MLDQTEAKYQTLGAPDPWAVLPGFAGRRYGKEAAANQKAAGSRSGKRYDEYGWARWSHRTVLAICTSLRIGSQQCDWLPLG
jgi:hypothetical protein